jgi:hypothetical protein
MEIAGCKVDVHGGFIDFLGEDGEDAGLLGLVKIFSALDCFY